MRNVVKTYSLATSFGQASTQVLIIIRNENFCAIASEVSTRVFTNENPKSPRDPGKLILRSLDDSNWFRAGKNASPFFYESFE